MEAGVSLLDATLRGTQSAVSRALGAEPAKHQPPVDGPRDVDEATSELANRVLRGVLRTAWRPGSLPEAARRLAGDAASSFRFRDPRQWLGLPVQLPLSLATLATQETLRGLAAVQAVPAERLADFTAFTVEIFTDLHVYFSLQYREELEHWQERVRRDPNDGRARLELGRAARASSGVRNRQPLAALQPALRWATISRATLREISDSGFDLFEQRIALPALRKLWIAWRTSRREHRRHRKLAIQS